MKSSDSSLCGTDMTYEFSGLLFRNLPHGSRADFRSSFLKEIYRLLAWIFSFPTDSLGIY